MRYTAGSSGGDGGERAPLAIMLVHQIERLAHARQHAEAEHIDFQDAQRVEIVLVPFDESAVVHRRIADRHHFVEPAAGDDEAADMLREMTREAVDLLRECNDLAHAPALRVEAGAGDGILRYRATAAAPDRGRQRADGVFAKTKGLADLADRRAAAIGNHGGGDAGAFAPVFAVDILDDLFAPLMLKIDVDVGRFAPLRRDETLEQKIGAVGIDLGHAEAETDRGIGGRAAALAENALRAREAHDVIDGEEIGRVLQLRDQFELVLEIGAHFVGNAPADSVAWRLHRSGALAHPGRCETLHLFVGIFVTQFVEREGERVAERHSFLDRFRRVAEQPHHFLRRF